MIEIPYFPVPDFVPKQVMEYSDFQDMFEGIKGTILNLGGVGVKILGIMLIAVIVVAVFKHALSYF